MTSLSVLAIDTDALVSDDLEHNSSSAVWSPIFVWEAFSNHNSAAQLLRMLDRASMRDSYFDMVRWNLTTAGKFTFKSFFLHLSLPLENSSS